MEHSFFELNAEKRIGYKLLSQAEKGMTEGHLTHIGLSSNVLTFLADKDVVKSAVLIHENYSDILSCSFDRITRKSGKYECPKIKRGEDKENSLTVKIQSIVKEKPNLDWLLIWVGLASEELVFWLIGSDSSDFIQARQIFTKGSIATALTGKSPKFDEACSFLSRKINLTTQNLQKELEIMSQIGESKRPFKSFDVEKANRLFMEIGYNGEELVNNYLEKEKTTGKISSFRWINKSRERGLPYDFIINGRIFIDVKATSFDFNQCLFFSSQEIDFIAHKAESSYAVFRVYDINTEKKKLKICKKCLAYMKEINNPIRSLNNCLNAKQAIIKTVKIGIKPDICFSEIQNPIVL